MLTVGSEVLGMLDRPRTVSSLWEAVRAGNDNARRRLSYDWFVLALDLLFLMDAVALREGLLIKSRTGV